MNVFPARTIVLIIVSILIFFALLGYIILKKKNSKPISKNVIINMFLVLVISICVCVLTYPSVASIFSDQEISGSSFLESGDNSIEATPYREDEIEGCGFDNPDVWGNTLIQVTAGYSNTTGYEPFINSDANGNFVLINDSAKIWELRPNQSQINWGEMNLDFSIDYDGSGTYSCLDRNTLSAYAPGEGSGMLKISERIQEGKIEVLIITNNGHGEGEFIPLELLDKSKEPVVYPENTCYYKFYLK